MLKVRRSTSMDEMIEEERLRGISCGTREQLQSHLQKSMIILLKVISEALYPSERFERA